MCFFFVNLGIVTTTRITHASPSGAHAHIAHRNWEADVDILADNGNTTICKDIAHQLIKKAPGSNFEVMNLLYLLHSK